MSQSDYDSYEDFQSDYKFALDAVNEYFETFPDTAGDAREYMGIYLLLMMATRAAYLTYDDIMADSLIATAVACVRKTKQQH